MSSSTTAVMDAWHRNSEYADVPAGAGSSWSASAFEVPNGSRSCMAVRTPLSAHDYAAQADSYSGTEQPQQQNHGYPTQYDPYQAKIFRPTASIMQPNGVQQPAKMEMSSGTATNHFTPVQNAKMSAGRTPQSQVRQNLLFQLQSFFSLS